jgi:ATP-dependent RNA helicase DDX42
MGWFDEDEEDEDEHKNPKPFSLSLSSERNATNDGGGVEEEDPLDAYMASLNYAKGKGHPKSERLDVENEEEATSHWKEAETTTTIPEHSSDPSEAKLALQTTFHKATATQKQERRQIDIQLEKTEHKGYTTCKKVFLSSTKSTSAGHEWRRKNEITCHPPADPIWDFAELVDIFPEPVFKWLSQEGFQKPTLVQAQTLGVALTGKDAIITASTGSGKTLAYLWPLVTHLIENEKKSRALILVPTRELALQVDTVAKSLFSSLPFTSLAITGGNMGRYQLSQALVKSKPHLIVATPGRLLDVLSAQQKSKQDWLLKTITFLVLDEADKMLQLGFLSQVSQILESLRSDRHSLLTSATIHRRLERHCHEWMNSPSRISVGRTGKSSEHVEQHVICLPDKKAKQSFLNEMLPTFCDIGRTLVFCATRDGCEGLGQSLKSVLPAVTLHGDKHPTDRKAALKAFAKGKVKLLVATDVAGRGLDIPEVSTVINFDPAKNWDTHVHRIGRAGRLSAEQQQSGTAYTLLLPRNADFANVLVQAYTREKRHISDDLRALSRRSRQNNGGSTSSESSRKATNKSGLGYYGPNDNVAGGGNDGYQEHPHKKGRWGS